MKIKLLMATAAALGTAWLAHRTLFAGGASVDEQALAAKLVAVVNARTDDWPQGVPEQSLRRCVSFVSWRADPIREAMPATTVWNGAWVLAEQTLVYNPQTQGTYLGNTWRDQQPTSSLVAALLDRHLVVRMPIRWLRYDPGLSPPPNLAPGIVFPTRPPKLEAASGDLLFGTAPDGFWFDTRPAFPDGPHKPPEMLVGPPGPTPRTAKPLGVQDFVGICWRLHATRVLEIGSVVDEGNNVRSVVAAVLRTPPSVPAWLTDTRIAGSDLRNADIRTKDVTLYRFRDFGGGWGPASDTAVLHNPGPLHPVGE